MVEQPGSKGKRPQKLSKDLDPGKDPTAVNKAPERLKDALAAPAKPKAKGKDNATWLTKLWRFLSNSDNDRIPSIVVWFTIFESRRLIRTMDNIVKESNETVAEMFRRDKELANAGRQRRESLAEETSLYAAYRGAPWSARPQEVELAKEVEVLEAQESQEQKEHKTDVENQSMLRDFQDSHKSWKQKQGKSVVSSADKQVKELVEILVKRRAEGSPVADLERQIKQLIVYNRKQAMSRQ